MSQGSICVTASSGEGVNKQQADYANLLSRLGTATHEEIERALQDREPAEPEPGLKPELMERMHRLLNR